MKIDEALAIVREVRQHTPGTVVGVNWAKDENVLAEKLVLNTNPSHRFAVGDHVHKPKGYRFPGIVRAVFLTEDRQVRLVVQMDNYRLLHIFNEDQLINDTRSSHG